MGELYMVVGWHPQHVELIKLTWWALVPYKLFLCVTKICMFQHLSSNIGALVSSKAAWYRNYKVLTLYHAWLIPFIHALISSGTVQRHPWLCGCRSSRPQRWLPVVVDQLPGSFISGYCWPGESCYFDQSVIYLFLAMVLFPSCLLFLGVGYQTRMVLLILACMFYVRVMVIIMHGFYLVIHGSMNS